MKKRTNRQSMHLLQLVMMLSLSAGCAVAGSPASAQAPADPCNNLHKPNMPLSLDLDQYAIKLKHTKRMCLDLRTTNSMTFRINVSVGSSGYDFAAGPITVKGKAPGGDAPEIRGENTAGNPELVTVTVTDSSGSGAGSKDYSYLIDIPGLGYLDPMVRIIRQGGISPLRKLDLEEALGEIGMTGPELAELLDEYPELLRPKD